MAGRGSPQNSIDIVMFCGRLNLPTFVPTAVSSQLPVFSEGKGHTFESCRVRQPTILHDTVGDRSKRRIKPHMELATRRPRVRKRV